MTVADKKIPKALLDAACEWTPSKDAAALAALAKLPYGNEYAGALYKRNTSGSDEWCYSVPVEGEQDKFAFSTDKNAGAFDGLFHSHPGGPHAARFSPDDVSVADALKRTSYIRENESGVVRRYDPGISEVQSAKKPGSMMKAASTSPGTVIGTLSRREQIEAALNHHTNTPDKE